MTPFRLTAPCKDYLWGGNRLRAYGKVSDKDCIAESWELSCHPDGESIIAEGEAAGSTLTQYLREHPEAMGERCARFDRFPVLIKLIDALDNLSVQVHPDDAYAMHMEGESGKTEMWYVVEAEDGAELIYGFGEELTKEEFRRAIEENTLLEKVNRIPVKPGDVFFIEAGTLHAIGKGLLIAEIQQNSNTTYRVYDYGRTGADGKPRPLHIDKALDVTTLGPAKPYAAPKAVHTDGESFRLLADCTYFTVGRHTVSRSCTLRADSASFHHILVIAGDGELIAGEARIPLTKGTSVFVPAGTGAYHIQGTCIIINTTIS